MKLKQRIELRIADRNRLRAITKPTIASSLALQEKRNPWLQLRHVWFGENHTFLHGAYLTLFGRPPDEKGGQSWLEQLGIGMPRNVLVRYLLTTAEARSHTLTDDWQESMDLAEASRPPRAIHLSWLTNRSTPNDFILESYMRYLARRPSEAEAGTWERRLRILKTRGRSWLLRKLGGSEERRTRLFDYERHSQMQLLLEFEKLDLRMKFESNRARDVGKLLGSLMEVARAIQRQTELKQIRAMIEASEERIVSRASKE